MKYRVGDKVKIREDLIVDNTYGSDSFAEEMEQYKGKTATIVNMYSDRYDIDIDDGDWSWTDEMFEDANKSETEFKVGDKVRIRGDLRQTTYGGFFVTQEMLELKGKEVTITEINKSGFSGRYGYRVDMGDSRCHWSKEMFEPVNKVDDSEVDDNKQVRTVDVGFHLDYCGRRRVLKDVIQGETGVNRLYYTKNYDIQYIIPIDAIDFIIPHED